MQMWYWGVFIIVAIVSMLAVAVELYPVARRDRAARPWAILAAASALAVPAAIVVHNVASALIGGEEAVSFILALLVAPAGFAIGTLGAGVVSLRSDRTLGGRILLAGLGLAIFAGYMLFALVVTTIEGGNPPYQAVLEPFALLAAALAMAAGAIGTAWSLIGARPTALSPSARH
jgi:hypothetical protein